MKINRFIDEIFTAYPFFGYRRITVRLAGHYGISLDPKHMQEMGIRAIYPRPSLNKSDKENKIYPYLLKDVEILRPNQVWSIDITYIPIRSSFLYLTAIIDWYSRYVISWEIDDTLDIGFVLETCQKALSEAVPEIMNSEAVILRVQNTPIYFWTRAAKSVWIIADGLMTTFLLSGCGVRSNMKIFIRMSMILRVRLTPASRIISSFTTKSDLIKV